MGRGKFLCDAERLHRMQRRVHSLVRTNTKCRGASTVGKVVHDPRRQPANASISVGVCMFRRACMAVLPVRMFYQTDDGLVCTPRILHRLRLCFYAPLFLAPLFFAHRRSTGRHFGITWQDGQCTSGGGPRRTTPKRYPEVQARNGIAKQAANLPRDCVQTSTAGRDGRCRYRAFLTANALSARGVGWALGLGARAYGCVRAANFPLTDIDAFHWRWHLAAGGPI